MISYIVLVHNHLTRQIEQFAVLADDPQGAAVEVAQVLMEHQRTDDLVLAILSERDVESMKKMMDDLKK